MKRLHEPDTSIRPMHECGPTAPAIRSYRQIATIFAERTGAPVSPVCVQQMCRAAETKFLCGAMADPVLRRWLHAGAPRSL